jgi:DNA-binding response OmpR family regulator
LSDRCFPEYPITVAKNGVAALNKPTETVLVVEDDVEMQKFLKDLLAPENLTIHTTANGKDGLDQALSLKPDLILLDLRLPGLDGASFCKAIRADQQTENIPIIVVTGVQSNEQLVQSMTAGADDFVSKPVNAWDLLNRVRAMLKCKHIADPVERLQRYIETVGEMGNRHPRPEP